MEKLQKILKGRLKDICAKRGWKYGTAWRVLHGRQENSEILKGLIEEAELITKERKEMESRVKSLQV